jgi:hypothetical protein
MGGKSSPPPPDYTGMEALGREQLAFSRQQYADMLPLAQRVAKQQMDAQDQQMRQAQDYYDYQRKTFRPVEQGLVRDAERFSTEDYREQIARDAALQAARAFEGTQAMGDRAAAARGISIDSPAALAMRNRGQYALATGTAQMKNNARTQAEQLGFARRMDVTGLGRGLAGASTAAYGGATGAGTAGMNVSMAPGGQAMQGMQQAGQTMGNVLSSQTSVYNTAQSKADPFATIVGTGLGVWAGGGFKGSDIRLKMNIERVGTDERTGLAIYEFEYKANPGERFRGVMAHEAEVNFPEAVITGPDGYKAVFYERLGMQMVRV